MIKMTLSSGAEVEFSGMNGDNFVAKEEMDTSIFTDENLKSGSVDGEPFENWEFLQQKEQPNGDFYISFCEKTPQDILNDEVKSLIVQLAEIAVSDGDLELEDIEGSFQDAVRVKIDDDKWIDR